MFKILESYRTVGGHGQAEIVEKKSRFIAHVMPVKSEKEALENIEKIKKQYWDARHNVFAFQLGERNEIQRYSDDGEPSGTAGMPVLEVLRGEDIKDTLIVVTRYFGGTLLGTGGLVRAYGRSAKEGLLQAGIIERILYTQLSITVDYTLSGKVQYEILQGEHILQDTVYTHNVEFKVLCRVSMTEGFVKNIINVTNGQAVINIGESIYADK